MTCIAFILPFQRTLPDHRTVQWFECEVHEGAAVRAEKRAFWSREDAVSWATGQGYEVRL